VAAGVEDMVLLRQLNDDAIVENLRKRLNARTIFVSFQKIIKKIYKYLFIQTYIGPVLVSVNPFAEVQKFGEQQMEQYQGRVFCILLNSSLSRETHCLFDYVYFIIY
jgi:myosin-1